MGMLSPKEILDCRNTLSCIISSGESLNNKIFPPDRLQCYVCDSLLSDSCAENQTNTKLIVPCVNYNDEEKCLKVSFSNGRGKLKTFISSLRFGSIDKFF